MIDLVLWILNTQISTCKLVVMSEINLLIFRKKLGADSVWLAWVRGGGVHFRDNIGLGYFYFQGDGTIKSLPEALFAI